MKQVEPVGEENLVAALREKDEKVLKLVYRQHYGTITNMVMNNGGSLQEAKDVYQDAVIVLYEKLQDHQFELNCLIKTFLYSVSRNIWLKQLKVRRKFEGTISDNDEDAGSLWDQSMDKEDQYQAMNLALEALGEPCSTIMRDFYIHKSSMEEITEKFGYTNSDNAKNQKYKCLKRLKKLFFSYYNNEGYDQQ